MKRITKTTDDAKQKLVIIGSNGEQIYFSLYYLPTQQMWVFDLAYDTFIVNGVQLVLSPNILRAYRKIIPFGIMCTSTDRLEPYYINDFISGRVKIYLLDSIDVEAIEVNIYQ